MAVRKKTQGSVNKALTPFLVSLDDIKLDTENARTHSEKNLKAIRGSLERFGQQKPIVVDQKRVVLAGNGTVLAARAAGWERIAAVEISIKNEAERKAFAIADNRTSELAAWDADVLATALRALSEIDSDLATSTGFTMEELAKLFGQIELPEVDAMEGTEYRVVVNVTDEEEQAKLISRLETEGYECQPLMS